MPSRIAQAVRYFVGALPGLGRTQLVKMLYMSDLEARRHLGRPITGLAYVKHNHGPFHAEILHQTDQLVSEGYVNEERVALGQYVGYRYTSTGKACPHDFKREELIVMRSVAEMFGHMNLQSLLDDLVYQTRPMVEATAIGEVLPMSLVDNEERIPGAELETVVRAVDQVNRGEGRPFEDVMAELRAR